METKKLFCPFCGMEIDPSEAIVEDPKETGHHFSAEVLCRVCQTRTYFVVE